MTKYYCGVDIGSTWTKAAIIDGDKEVVALETVRTALSFEEAAAAARDGGLEKAGLSEEQLAATVSTGYGRMNATFADAKRTEISCHAKGAFHYYPHPCHVIDIGGQDNKIISVDDKGQVIHFLMNRKCAAGTGAFVEEIARRMALELGEIESLAEGADKDMTLSSFCTVFSATEVIRLIREGEKAENICKGIFNSVVARVVEMGELGDRIALTGGVASSFPIVKEIIEKKTGAEVFVPPDAQHTGAIGAALYAFD